MSKEIVLLVFGLSLGAVYALIVLGLVLTYRTSKFLNLAHGALGMVVTYIFWQLAVGWGLPTWLSAVLTLGLVAPIVGVVAGRVLFRGVMSKDDTSKIAASVIVILVLNEAVSRIWSAGARDVPSLMPAGSVAIGGARLGWDQLIPIGIAIGVAALIVLGLTKTSIGVQMRAVAEDRALAASFGCNVARVEAIGWALATVLAGAAGLLIAPLSALTPLSLTFLVVSGLAAAAVGRLTSVAGALAGAALLGVAQSEVVRLPAGVIEKISSPSSAMPFLLLAGAIGVMVRAGVDVGGGSADQAAGVRSGPAPRWSGALRLGRALRRARRREPALAVRLLAWAAAAALAAGGTVAVGSALDASWLFLFTAAAVWTVAFASVGLLNGLGRQVSLCQASFMGVGALVAARVGSSCAGGAATGQVCASVDSPARAWLAPVAAMVVAGLVGVLVAAGATRVRGVMLAVATLSFGFFLDNTIFPAREISGGEFGFPMQRPTGFTSPVAFWVLCAALALGAVLVVRNLGRSATGRVMRGIEQSPQAVAAFGIRPAAYKLATFGVSAAMAGLAGYLYGALLGSFTGGNYSTFLSLFLFVVVSMIGTHTATGPVVTAAFYVLVPKLLNSVGGEAGDANSIYALGALVTLSLPGGVLGWLSLRRAAARSQARGADDLAPPDWLFEDGAAGHLPGNLVRRG